jgi:hypothetical protein
MIEVILTALLGPSSPRVCICDWTVAWTPEVQHLLGFRGGFHEAEKFLFGCELLLALVLVVALGLGRWRIAATILVLAIAFPLLVFTSLFGTNLGLEVLRSGGPELTVGCAVVLAPALVLGGLLRGAWLLVRAIATAHGSQT